MTRRPQRPGGFGPGNGFGFDPPGYRTARRVRRGGPHHHPHRSGMAVPSPWIALPLVILLVGMIGSAAAMTAFAAVSFSPLFLLAVIAITAQRAGRRRPMMAPPPTVAAPRPHPPVAPPWDRSRARFDRLREEYTAYECDPMAVLRLPALADVAVPSTGRFVEAFAEAQALDTDSRPADRRHAEAFVAAVDRAVRAWEAAKDAAERIRHSTLSTSERSSVERAIKLLTTARDSDNDAERHAAYALARSELAKLERAGVVHLPRQAVAALENDGRGHLSA